MSISIAIIDATNNCINHNATATIVLKGSGVKFSGRLKKRQLHDSILIHKKDGGWVTIDIGEIAAVETTPATTTPGRW